MPEHAWGAVGMWDASQRGIQFRPLCCTACMALLGSGRGGEVVKHGAVGVREPLPSLLTPCSPTPPPPTPAPPRPRTPAPQASHLAGLVCGGGQGVHAVPGVGADLLQDGGRGGGGRGGDTPEEGVSQSRAPEPGARGRWGRGRASGGRRVAASARPSALLEPAHRIHLLSRTCSDPPACAQSHNPLNTTAHMPRVPHPPIWSAARTPVLWGPAPSQCTACAACRPPSPGWGGAAIHGERSDVFATP